MARALALTLARPLRIDALEIARQLIVFGCAAALILAGKALPF